MSKLGIQVRYIVQSPLDVCLEIWVSWTRRDNLNNNHRDRVCDHDNDDTAYIMADIKTAEAVDVIVYDLPLHQQWAVRKRCGISPAVWRYPNLDYAVTLESAERAMIQKMKKSFACCKYFD